jgi:membrane protease YdiL (CAAX protease family)
MASAESATQQTRGILLYLVCVIVLSGLVYTLFFAPTPFAGGGGGHYVEALMWCPAMAAFLALLLTRGDIASLGLSRFAPRYALAGYLIPLAYAALAYIAVWSTGLGGFPSTEGIAKLAAQVGWHVTAPAFFIPPYFLLVATTFMVGSVAHALGEEIGWRGYLAPRMVARLGFTWGAILSGAIWACWHLPIMIFGNYNAGTPFWFGFTCFASFVIASAVIMTWLRLKSNSVWPSVVMHASHNAFIQTFFTPLTAPKGTLTAYAIDEFGFVTPLLAIAIAVYFWRRRAEVVPA